MYIDREQLEELNSTEVIGWLKKNQPYRMQFINKKADFAGEVIKLLGEAGLDAERKFVKDFNLD